MPEHLRWGAFSAEFSPLLEMDSGNRVMVDIIHGGPGRFPEEMWDRLLPEHREYLST